VGASVGFECKTSKNHGKIDIKQRPLVFVNRNLFDFGASFTKTTNRVIHSVSTSKLFPESENPNFPGKMRRKLSREVRVLEIGEVGGEREEETQGWNWRCMAMGSPRLRDCENWM
jgi:hypothetical protein